MGWKTIEIEGTAAAHAKCVRAGVRVVRGGSHVLMLTLGLDVTDQFKWEDGQDFRVALGTDDNVGRLMIVKEQTGPFTLKFSERSPTVMRLAVRGLKFKAPFAACNIEWKRQGDGLIVYLPHYPELAA